MALAIVLAVGAAIGWGASDYFGGEASRGSAPVLAVVAAAEVLGVVWLLPVLVARGIGPATNPRMLLAAGAGLAVTVELGLIYRALSRGNAFVTAPAAALGVGAAVTIGLIGGDPLNVPIGGGLVCALAGASLCAGASPGATRGTGVRTFGIALGAAAAITVMLVCIHAAGRVDPYWAIAIEHLSTAVSAGLAALALRQRARAREGERPRFSSVALIATVGVGGDLAYAVASHGGALSTVAAISSLYPVTTIGLARVLRHSKATRVQLLGVGLALFGAVVLGGAAS